MRILWQGRLSCTVELAELTVTALLDGSAPLAPGGLRDAEGRPCDPDGTALQVPVRAFAVRGARGCLMIDCGAGQPSSRLSAAMAEAGLAANAVTAVALTHTHGGHLGGLVDRDGGLAFPHAGRVFVATEELAAFRSTDRMWPVEPRLMPLEQGDGPLHGVSAINAPGHSPGHMAYLVEGRLLIWGDLVHHAPVQFARPDVGWHRDADPATARISRAALMEQAVEAGWLVAGAHLPDPGLGRIERAGPGYAFHPLTRTA